MMKTTEDELRDVIQIFQDQLNIARNELNAEMEKLERQGWPSPATELFRAKTEFFSRFVNNQANAVEAYQNKVREEFIQRTAAALRGERS